MNSGVPWTDEDTRLLTLMLKERQTQGQMAAALNRSRWAIKAKIRSLNLPPKALKSGASRKPHRRRRAALIPVETMSAFDEAFARMERPAASESAFNRLPPPTLVSAGEAMS